MPSIRRALIEDAVFLQRMLALAADWQPETAVRSPSEIMDEPALAHYIAGWPAEGDVGFVAEEGTAEEGTPVGAVWWRSFSHDDPGYGFVAESVPELSIGVIEEARGEGVGTMLLEALIDEARRRALPALSLSIEQGNPAATLYQRLGFVTLGHVGGSLTMVPGLLA